jgi:penicillin-binding protein 1A
MAAIAGREVDPRKTFYVSKPLDLRTRFGPVKVQTYANTYPGRVNLVKATLSSDNSVYQQLDLDIGPDLVADTAEDLGIETPLEGYPAEGLGGLTHGVTPLELARAYATFATGGLRVTPTAIARVELPGGRVEELGGEGDAAFRDGEVAQVTKILRANMRRGTGIRARIGCPAAGKTGTTEEVRDAWFAGYTPRLSTVVWVGYPKRSASMTNVHGLQVAGGTFPALIWRDYMRVAKGAFCGAFPKPVQVVKLKPYCGDFTVTRGCAPKPKPDATPAAPPSIVTAVTEAAAIDSGPDDQTHATRATFVFSGGTTFECRLDSAPFEACASPVVYERLELGPHVFYVRATGLPGEQPVASWRWQVLEELVVPAEKKEPPKTREGPQVVG